jgi:membrane protein DedA with SNARE-associated domain
VFIGMVLLVSIVFYWLAFYKLVKNSLLKKKGKTSRRKRWLFEEIIHQYGGFAGIIIFRFIYSFKSLITQMILK